MKDKPVLLPVGGSFEIEYVNAEGIGSRRVIDVRKFVANLSDGYVQAFCHERKMVRNVLNISRLWDWWIWKPAKLSNLRFSDGVCRNGMKRLPNGRWIFFIREMKPIVDVLVYIAYCDGRYAPSEQRYIAQWLTDKSEMGDDFLAYSLGVMKSWPVPDSMDFSFAIRAINQRFPDWRDSVLEYARNVAKADRKVTDEETNQLEKLERLFDVFREKA